MSTVIVTGGAGFIGANYVRYAHARTEDRLVVIDKLTYAGNLANLSGLVDDPRVTFIRADIADRRAMEDIFRAHRPRYVVNFAAESHVDRSIDDPTPFIETNIFGAFILLEVARQHLKERPADEASAFRFLHVSTDEVYGSLGSTGLFSETTPYAPNSPYAASKASADHLVRAYSETYGLPAIIAYALITEGNPLQLNWSWTAVGCVIYLTVAGTIAAFWLYYWLLSRIESTKAMMISLVTPLLAVILGWLFLGETLPPQTFFGGLLIIASIGLIVMKRRKPDSPLQDVPNK